MTSHYNSFNTAQQQRAAANLAEALKTVREACDQADRTLARATPDSITVTDIAHMAKSMTQGLANSMTSVSSALNAIEMQAQSREHELSTALSGCLSYLADLNGCEWIKGDHPAQADMRQRAKNLQALAAQALRVESLMTPPADKEAAPPQFGPYTDDDDTSHLMGG